MHQWLVATDAKKLVQFMLDSTIRDASRIG
jgi:hypothetical protein